MITIENLTKRYRKATVLNDLSLTIEKGLFGLLGPNGAGKTTLMRMIATLLPLTSGNVVIDGVSLKENPHAIRGKIGYLPQYFNIYPQLKGREFLNYVAVMKGINDKQERMTEVSSLLKAVNLENVADRKLKTYSGGMKQRIGIAQALIGNPEVLIVDEPTAGLDPEERVRFRNLLSDISTERAVILSTHIVADIESSCDQLAVLNKGQLMMTGNVTDLIDFAEGKMWEVTVHEREKHLFKEEQIVATRRAGSDLFFKILSEEKPSEYATPTNPTLEDGYMALIGGQGHV
ncbi:ABC transporter ATP-binding protein [Salipaludibacillus agaradhaerens]|uniref:ABC transporter ATP-binding protein n=1 Tax=Salipaludibacillus agaradhaerens TaxID=76935 RepID=UPI00099627C3|nr:ABC transporter ATP-binding protein [Salipaludibacillus agaradhaerens]